MGCCGSKTAPEEDGSAQEPEKVKVAAPASSSAKKKKKKSAKKPEFIAPWRKEKLEEKQKLKESETGKRLHWIAAEQNARTRDHAT